MKIIDNFLDKKDFKDIQDLLLSTNINWFYVNDKSIKGDNQFQFVHTFYENHNPVSHLYNNLLPILNKLNVYAIRRIKANLTTKTNKLIKYKLHTDFPDNLKEMKTAIFYINTNNGKTFFENNKQIDSIENRMIIFSSNIKHTGTSNTDKNRRIVINFNYY